MKQIKLSDNQKSIIRLLRFYKDEIIMDLRNGYWLTGGHGVKFDGRSIQALRKAGIINRNQLSEESQTIEL